VTRPGSCARGRQARAALLGATALLLLAREARAEGAPPEAERLAILSDLRSQLELERVRVPARQKSIRLESVRQRIVISFDRTAPRTDPWNNLLRACPVASADGARIILSCTTGRIEVALVATGKQTYLDVRKVRGIPVRSDANAVPYYRFDPATLGLGEACPGTTDAGRGECLLATGDDAGARSAFERALTSHDQQPLAALRLGDLALGDGNTAEALRLYGTIQPSGPIGRLAAARRCEMTGACLGGSNEAVTFGFDRLPEPLATEMTLRRVRVLALTGHLRDGALLLSRRLKDPDRPPACEKAHDFCEAITLAALDRLPPDDAPVALGLFLLLPERTKSGAAMELAEAAARSSEAAHAPRFGGNVLAIAAASVPASRLDAYLREAVRLFIAGGDQAHAEFIMDFAREKLGPKTLARPDWSALERSRLALAHKDSHAATGGLDSDAISEDLARAANAVAAAHDVSLASAANGGKGNVGNTGTDREADEGHHSP
jgi:hypothetical protein